MSWLKGVLFFIKLAIVCSVAVLFSLYPGDVSIHWFDYQTDMPISALFAVIFTVIAGVVFVGHFWRRLWSLPKQYRLFLERRRAQKGQKLLIDSLTAIAAQQPEEAYNTMELAKVLVPNHPLTAFVAAQSAHMLKDYAKATEYFNRMLQDPDLRFLGLRGLILQKKELQDWLAVEALLKQALALRPDSPWVQQEILKNQLELAQSGQDRAITTQNINRHLSRDTWRQHQAAVFWLKAQRHLLTEEIYESAVAKAWALDKSNVIYALALAQVYKTNGKISKAVKVISKTYHLTPHRSLGDTWRLLYPQMSALDHYKGLEKLTRDFREHVETHWILAESALKAELWGQARHWTAQLLRFDQTAPVCLLMARIEEAQDPRQHQQIHAWWKRATETPAGESWVCCDCGEDQTSWNVFCEACAAPHTLKWKRSEKTKRLLSYQNSHPYAL